MITLPADHAPGPAAVNPLALVRLLQWTSPTLPVGGFSYSQGLESAVESGMVRDAASAGRWIRDVLDGPVGGVEAAFLARFLTLWQDPTTTSYASGVHDGRASAALPGEPEAHLRRLDQQFQGSRESAQLLAETRQMGWSLLSLVHGLPPTGLGLQWPAIAHLLKQLAERHQPSYLLVWSGLATACAVPAGDAIIGWLWSWLENQVMAALKTVPLGQSAGQTLLLDLAAGLPDLAQQALLAAGSAAIAAETAAIGFNPGWLRHGPGNYAPGFGLACAQHETQYSRLFRS